MPQSNGGVSTTSRLTLFPMQNPSTGITGFYSFDPTRGFNDPNASSTHSFKVEEVQAGRTPTVSRIILQYRDLGPVIIILTLNGTDDSQKVVSNQTAATLGNQIPTGKLMTKLVGLALTGQNLQLTVFRPAGAGPLSLAKVVLCGRIESQELA